MQAVLAWPQRPAKRPRTSNAASYDPIVRVPPPNTSKAEMRAVSHAHLGALHDHSPEPFQPAMQPRRAETAGTAVADAETGARPLSSDAAPSGAGPSLPAQGAPAAGEAGSRGRGAPQACSAAAPGAPEAGADAVRGEHLAAGGAPQRAKTLPGRPAGAPPKAAARGPGYLRSSSAPASAGTGGADPPTTEHAGAAGAAGLEGERAALVSVQLPRIRVRLSDGHPPARPGPCGWRACFACYG